MQKCKYTPIRLPTGLSSLVLVAVATAALSGQQTGEREPIGEVLGQPVYRDQIHAGGHAELRDQLHRLFTAPVLQKYRQAHRAEIEPTEAEITATAAHLREKYAERMQQESQKLRERLRAVDEKLAQSDLTEKERQEYEKARQIIQTELDTPGRSLALFLLKNWKFQKHLYDRYGGGRILWQQAGVEAFDAYRRWLEAHEQQGDFKITDPELRTAFYEYWTTMKHGAFLTDDEERIRGAFLEPEWLPRDFHRD